MNPKVRVLVAFMKSNLHRELSLDELGALVGLSHSRLHSLFKTELSMAPIQYRRTLRLEEARLLLEHSY